MRKERNQPAYVVHTARFVAERRGIAYDELEAAVAREQRAPVRLVSELPVQPSLRRMTAFGIRPKRDLGQNFLIDSNLLDVIARAAELGPDDVVLEVGGGLGVLSEHLAERVAHVHVVELDRTLEPALRDALDPHPNTTLHLADAVKLDLAALDPPPTKVVANLPYGVAATVILRTVAELPRVDHLGRDGAEGGGASGSPREPGTPAYGVPVRARPARLRRARPAPRVAHRLPSRAERRLRPGRASRAAARRPSPALRALVQPGLRAPAQGARPLARARARAPRRASATARAPRSSAIGRPADARAEQLAPDEWRALARGARRDDGAARRARRARSTCACSSAAPRQDGYHPLVSLVQPRLARRRARRSSPPHGDADEVVCPGVEGENLAAARDRAASARRPAGTARRVRITIAKRVPVAAGMGGGSADAAAALRLARRRRRARPRRRAPLRRIAVGARRGRPEPARRPSAA